MSCIDPHSKDIPVHFIKAQSIFKGSSFEEPTGLHPRLWNVLGKVIQEDLAQ